MKISTQDPQAQFCIVFLNGRRVKATIAADDEEGWVDIIDVQRLAPLNNEAELEFSDPAPVELEDYPTKRLFGKVSFIWSEVRS